ncbi:MAG: alpha/beta fold hydrolase [Armatimonadetes bacterium]|nr:alpha/beta fold hydrolase [Armatimonadota bacterium]MDE2206758.1 alpha/beta fold hydrolase [Armatimonadota bacterium]
MADRFRRLCSALTVGIAAASVGACHARNPTSAGAYAPPAPDLAPAPTVRTVRFHTADGWTIVGDEYDARKPTGEAVLLHERDGSAADWKPLCLLLQKQHIVCIAIDQRGNGRSTSGPGPSGLNAPWDTSGDVTAVLNKTAPGTRVALVGASYGANNALLYAAAHPGAAGAVVLFSPGADYRGLNALAAAPRCTAPVLIFHSSSDPIAGSGPAQIIAKLGGEHTLKLFAGTRHGTALLGADVDAITAAFLTHMLAHGGMRP